MCRWLAYSGSPVLLQELLYGPKNSLIVQSLHSRLGAEETNGDGFGVGWYGAQETPAVFRSIEPAWNDRNLRELADHVTATTVFAHIRASTGSPVQQTNCHPFRHGRWLWMHNGFIGDYQKVKRDLVLAIDPDLYPEIEGTTDSETLFPPRVDVRPEENPPEAVARAIGFVESVGRETWRRVSVPGNDRDDRRREHLGLPVLERGQVTFTLLQHGRPGAPCSLPRERASPAVRRRVQACRFRAFGDELPGAWNEVPESSWGVIKPGQDEMHPFTPTGDRVGSSR
jgi:glutamine amidotransferase